MATMDTTDDEKADEKQQAPAPPSAQNNPQDTQPHGGGHSPDKAKGGASDSDGANG